MPDCSFPSIFESRFFAAAAFAALLAGCAGSGPVPAPTAKNVEYAGRNGQATTLEALKVGRKLYIGRCAACHNLKDPKSIAPADWPEMVERMASNAKITPDQQRAITQYVVSISAAARDESAPAAPKTGAPEAAPAPGAGPAPETAPAK